MHHISVSKYGILEQKIGSTRCYARREIILGEQKQKKILNEGRKLKVEAWERTAQIMPELSDSETLLG